MEIKIGNKYIGNNYPCFIIAEAGVNHNGSLELAKKLVDAAKEAGVDAVKFQTFKTEELVVAGSEQFEMLKNLELRDEDFKELKKYCDEKNIIFLSTPHTPSAVDFLEPLICAYKISSGDLTNLPLLEKVTRKNKPIILSTGMSYLKEIKEALKFIKKTGNKKIILLHCTTSYPCPLGEVNLRAMLTLKKEFNLPVGYSDHADNIFVPVMAIAMGARVLEKHFTLDKNLPGPDHKASLDPKELREMILNIREAEKIMGSFVKKPAKSEEYAKKMARKSIIAAGEIKKGEIITKSMVAIKRPGNGIPPAYLSKILGRTAKVKIEKDQLLKFSQLK